MEEARAHKAGAGNLSPGCKSRHLIWADVMLSFSFTSGSDLVLVPV